MINANYKGFQTRVTKLGHVQRSGNPTSFDRTLAVVLAAEAVRLLAEGHTDRMVSLSNGKITSFTLDEVVAAGTTGLDAHSDCVKVPLQSGRLSLPVRLTPNDLCYLQAAACLRELEDANRAKRPGYELLVKGALLRFLALLIAQGKQCLSTETADTQRLKTVLQLLSAHYAEPLRVADAAGVCSFSASHFMRWFRQMTGQSFIAFLNEYRLNTAAEALRTTDETVLTIASRCGFENLSYFNRAFKAHFGMTPRDYRKK